MFFLKLLESKKWWKLTSFGVDMFFSNSCKSKNGENGLVLVLTCFFSNFWCWHVFLKLVQVKKWGKLTSFGVDMFFSQTFGVDMFFSNSCKSKNWENWLVLVLTDWNLEPSGKLPSFGVDMFFSNFWNPKYVENWLALVLTCFFLNSWNQKKWWKLTSFGVDMFFSNSWNPKMVKID